MASLSTIPDELVILIAEACDVPDKARLARSNRRLNALVSRVLLRYSVREEGNSAMYWAAEHGNINVLESMLASGAEINDKSGSLLSIVARRIDSSPRQSLQATAGFLPLHIAAKFGQDSAVRWLLSKGARIESLAQHVCQCEFYITEGRRDGNILWNLWTPLHIAICSGHISTARLLISRGASIRSPAGGPGLSTNVLHTAAHCNNTAAIEFLVGSGLVGADEPDSMGYVALHYACERSDNLPAVKMLVHLGASADIVGGQLRKTPLLMACQKGFFDAAIEILEKGARHDASNRPNAARLLRVSVQPYSSYRQPHPSDDRDTWEECREDFLRRLVGLGVNVDERIASLTPLAVVAANKRSLVRTLRVLIELGADVNAMDNGRRNPIYMVLFEGQGEDFYTTTAHKVDLLLRYGARPDLQDKTGECAFDMALEICRVTGDASIMGFILQHGMVANHGHRYLHDKIAQAYSFHKLEVCRLLAGHGAVLQLSDPQFAQDIRWGISSRNLERMNLLLDLFPGRIQPYKILELVIHYYQRAEERNINIIKSLLARPEFNPGGSGDASRLLQFACRHHSPVFIAQLLLEKGGRVNEFDSHWETPLSCAVGCGCRPMVRLLLQQGADPHLAPSDRDWSAYVCEASCSSDPERPDSRDPRYPTSFMRAIREFHNHAGTHRACQSNADEILLCPLELMLEHLPLPPLPQDPQALSYIHFALEWPEALRFLLAKGADPNSGDHCTRPPLLHYLTMADRLRPARPDALKILLEFGADIHRTDAGGRSFLTMMRKATLAMAKPTLVDIEFDGEKLGFAAGLLVRNFFITLDEASGEDCVKARPEAIAEANYQEYLDRLAAHDKRQKQMTS